MEKVIQVRQEDIDGAVRGDGRNCPVALALKRELGGMWTVGALAAAQNGSIRLFLPYAVRAFVKDFDHRLPVEPFSFSLNVEGLRLPNDFPSGL